MCIRDRDTETVPITQINPNDRSLQYRSLGVRLPGTLENTKEFTVMLMKSRRFAKFLAACPLTRYEALISYSQFFIPSVAYGAVELSLTHVEIEQLHRIYIPRLLPRLGYQSSFPRAVTFAPKIVGGIGLVPLNTIITQRKITFMIRQFRAHADLGKVLLINLRWTQIQAGRRAPLFLSLIHI